MNEDLIKISASEVSELEYCEISWRFSRMSRGEGPGTEHLIMDSGLRRNDKRNIAVSITT